MVRVNRGARSRSMGRRIRTGAAVALAAAAVVGASWPRTSQHPVAPLDHPTVESRMKHAKIDPKGGFEFLAFGDQRELLESDWPILLDMMAGLAAQRDRLLFLVDTGDIVDDGAYSDQFRTLAELLRKLERLPYLAAAGNHEVGQNAPGGRGWDRAGQPALLHRVDLGDGRFLVQHRERRDRR